MEEKNIRIIPFSVEKEKWRIWSGKFLESAWWLGYDIILRGTVKTLTYNKEDNTREDDIPLL